MKELTFKEVIANIKEGEVWESAFLTIKKVREGIAFEYKEGYGFSTHVFSETTIYKLKRKEYTFQEAFKAYEEGKEIESENSRESYKKINGSDMIFDGDSKGWIYNEFDLTFKEIRGKWYIND